MNFHRCMHFNSKRKNVGQNTQWIFIYEGIRIDKLNAKSYVEIIYTKLDMFEVFFYAAMLDQSISEVVPCCMERSKSERSKYCMQIWFWWADFASRFFLSFHFSEMKQTKLCPLRDCNIVKRCILNGVQFKTVNSKLQPWPILLPLRKCTQKNLVRILLNHTEIRLYLPIFYWLETDQKAILFQINQKMMDTIRF